MKATARLNLSGPFLAEDLGRDRWRLGGVGGAAQVYLKLADAVYSDVAAAMKNPITRLDIEWRDSGAVVELTQVGRTDVLEVRTAIVHQTRKELYDELPLAAFDAKARGFWKRVFLLIRIPGGRHFLGLMVRRSR